MHNRPEVICHCGDSTYGSESFYALPSTAVQSKIQHALSVQLLRLARPLAEGRKNKIGSLPYGPVQPIPGPAREPLRGLFRGLFGAPFGSLWGTDFSLILPPSMLWRD